MIKCPVCSAENDAYAVTCIECRAFIQNRLPNLDLFETAWGVLESPRATFQKITLAEHKNYSTFLFLPFGIGFSFTGFWYFRLGDRFETLLDLMAWGVGVGIATGLVAAGIIPFLYHLLVKALGGKKGFRTSFALIAYSAIPIVISVFVVLPIELLTFGIYLFTSNPHPYAIKPISYVILLGLDIVVTLWTVTLMIVGTSIGHGLSIIKSAIAVLATVGVLGGAVYLVSSTLQA